MRGPRLLRSVGWATVSIVLLGPLPLYGQAPTSADVNGTWRKLRVMPGSATWDPAKGVSVRMYEKMFTLAPDGTYTTELNYIDEMGARKAGGWGLGNIVASKGQWTVAGDTLVVRYLPDDTLYVMGIRNKNKPGKFLMGGESPDAAGDTVWAKRPPESAGPSRATLARSGTTLTLIWLRKRVTGNDTAWAPVPNGFPDAYERLDPTQPRPPMTPSPSTVNRTDLVGVWATQTGAGADTLTLHADGTWAALEGGTLDGGSCKLVKPAETSNTGKWYLGPANVVVFIDAVQRHVCGTATRWRGGEEIRLQGQQLIVPYAANKLVYDRVRASAP